MDTKDVERLNKKLLPIFEKAKRKYKGKNPTLTFVIFPQENHEFIGMKNENEGNFEGTLYKI